jgi:hypothetical protein
MLEILQLIGTVGLIILIPNQARKIAGGEVNPRHKGTPEEYRAQYRRGLAFFMGIGIAFGLVNLWLSSTGVSHALEQGMAGLLWFGVAVSAFLGRRVVRPDE